MPVNPQAVGKVQVPFGAQAPKEPPAEENNPYLDEVRKVAKARLVGQSLGIAGGSPDGQEPIAATVSILELLT